MPVSYAQYALQDGYIDHWLAAGPQAIPVNISTQVISAEEKLEISRPFLAEKHAFSVQPVERGPLNEGLFTIGDYQGKWDYYRCGEDHLVDHSAAYPGCRFTRSWAYTHLVAPADQPARFVLTTYGPVEVTLNKKLIFHSEAFSKQPLRLAFEAPLAKGANKILVRFTGVATPRAVQAFSLRLSQAELEQASGSFQVRIPTLIPSLERRASLETAYDMIYLDRDVYSFDDRIVLHFPENLNKNSLMDVRLQTPSGRIYGQAEEVGRPGQELTLGQAPSLPAGPYQVFAMPRAWEYYESQIRITRTLDLWSMGRSRFSATPYGTLEERRSEALRHAARTENHLFAEIAKMALGAWQNLELKPIQLAAESIQRREPGSEIQLLGLLGALARYGSHEAFTQELKDLVRDCATGFRYTQEMGGSAAQGCDGLDFSADRLIAFYACAILAGQLFPDLAFTGGLTGQQLRQEAETQALDWMQARGQSGWIDWDAKDRYALALMALSHLADLAQADEVWELSSILMDKLFFSLALNAHQGVFGVTQGSATLPGIQSGLLEETSSITRLMWGLGVFNHHIDSVVSLACQESYELPPILPLIAASTLDEIWNREQQGQGESTVNKVTYRTPDYMLSSAQDYHPGRPGQREHIWQATLGPQCVVFTNHPGCSSTSEAHAPNFWLGNGVLPRVAQYKDVLIALYRLPEDELLGFTHAYFPARNFDEYVVNGNTAFARKGDGYLALTASQPVELADQGRYAYRELRAAGRVTLWVCQLGRAALDGSFADFQEKVLAAPPSIQGLDVELQTLRGDTLSFGWERPFLRNGEEQPLSGFMHFENPFTTAPFPSTQMEIIAGEYLLRLNFGEQIE